MLTITKGSGLGKCERAGTKWEGGAKHEACNLVSDKEVMCDLERIPGEEDLSCGEGVRWEDTRTWWC